MQSLSPLVRAVVLAAGLAAVSSPGFVPDTERRPQRRIAATAPVSSAPIDVGPEIAAFYRDRGFRPIWADRAGLRPESQALLAMVPATPELDTAVRAAASGDPRALTRADLLLTRAYVERMKDLRRAPATSRMRYIDPGLAPAAVPIRQDLDALASAPSLAAHLASAARRNPAYDGLVRGLAVYREHWSRLPQMRVIAGRLGALRRRLGVGEAGGADAALAARLRAFQTVHGLPASGRADPATIAALNRGAAQYERLILANIERARAIPAAPGRRYILVDTASARLWMVEDGRFRDSMKVIVGKREMQTPEMAGLVRYAMLNPYWNLPPDLIRKRAGNAARRGPGGIAGERLQVLSDWSDQARVLNPRQVDWRAVAAGRRLVNLRQLPGPQNMMGRVKFMLPNDLGVYLHDTPLRALFAGADRRQSSGCIRLEDAQRLGRWLFHGAMPRASGAAEQRVDLPEPVPVYITYLTALPSRGGIVFRPDSYGRDRTLLASLR
jgi:murein L,D-transpeptidase YcbB/YkuD